MLFDSMSRFFYVISADVFHEAEICIRNIIVRLKSISIHKFCVCVRNFFLDL